MSTLPSVDNRAVVRCDHCRLVQFQRPSEICKRCKRSYAPKPPEQVGNADPPAACPGESCAAQSAFPQIIGQNIRACREVLGWSQRELSKRMGVQRTYVSKIERGAALPLVKRLEEFAAILRVSPRDLLVHEPFIHQIAEALPHLNRRQREYLATMVRDLAGTEARQSA